ncbi:hypothetical protein [Pseudoflavitalea rhizosphaerae]|uniref:hypothetical protein n=1 Tax=Pseudoflavitalea rhizosphaerae TaxID=1884793 RepID=UPI000F8E852E|nr:hypothetical protein [Pseudoflavitalea rhizosphaerae]
MVNYKISDQSNLLEGDLNIIRKEAKKKNRMVEYRIIEFGKIENNLFVLARYLKNNDAVLQLQVFIENKKVEGIITTIYHNVLTDELIIVKFICNKSVACDCCIYKIINQMIVYGINNGTKFIKGIFPLSEIEDELLLAFKWLQFSINIAEGKVSVCLKL